MDVCGLIWNEYALVHDAYESYNGYFLTLKGWSVTAALASIIAVYSEKIGSSGKIVLWVAALSSIPFWVLDAIWKSYQSAYLDRLAYLEGIGDCKMLESHKLGFIASWRSAHEGFNALDWVGFTINTAFPHMFILIIGIFLVWKFPPSSSQPDT